MPSPSTATQTVDATPAPVTVAGAACWSSPLGAAPNNSGEPVGRSPVTVTTAGPGKILLTKHTCKIP